MIILLIANLQNKYFFSSSRQIRVQTPQVRVRLFFFACVTCRVLSFAKYKKNCVIIKVHYIALFRQNIIREKWKVQFQVHLYFSKQEKYEFLADLKFSIKCAIYVYPGRFWIILLHCININTWLVRLYCIISSI